MSKAKPWGGRFSQPTDALVEAFSASIEADRHIALDDVAGSIAHARMLGATHIISQEDAETLCEGLARIEGELRAGRFPWRPELEDVHMNVEHRLGELVGEEVAGRLHTARSRNDQVALDTRLYMRRRLEAIGAGLLELQAGFVGQAEQHVDTLLPGYTHLQRAQPIRLAHHLLAYAEMFERDGARVRDALARINLSPLGSGALAGTPHPIDRDQVAADLGLAGVTQNSLDGVSARDHLLEAMSASAISMTHLSRWSEELVLWNSAEFGFVEMDDAFATGSSMMPQKKNPDVAELVRGKVGRVVGDLMGLLMTVKALPLAYNRDLQEDKPALIDSLDTWHDAVMVMARMMPTLRFQPEAMRAALDAGYVTATELADYLVQKGVAFREAHHVVGQIVGDCVPTARRLAELSASDLKRYHVAFEADALAWLDPEQSVERRAHVGGPARARVRAAIDAAKARLAAHRAESGDVSL